MCPGCGGTTNYILWECQNYCYTGGYNNLFLLGNCNMTTVGWIAIALLCIILITRLTMEIIYRARKRDERPETQK